MKIEVVLTEVARRCDLVNLSYSKARSYSITRNNMVNMQPLFKPVFDESPEKHMWRGMKIIKGKLHELSFLITGKQFPEKMDDLIEILCNHFGAEDGVLKGAFKAKKTS